MLKLNNLRNGEWISLLRNNQKLVNTTPTNSTLGGGYEKVVFRLQTRRNRNKRMITMSKGRPQGSKNKMELSEALITAVGPAIEEAVAAEKKEKEAPKSVPYCKIKLRNLLDRGFPASFTYDGLSYNIPENVEVDVMKEVADHLSNILVKQYAFTSDPNRPGKNKKVIEDSPRFIVQILETYEKEV